MKKLELLEMVVFYLIVCLFCFTITHIVISRTIFKKENQIINQQLAYE